MDEVSDSQQSNIQEEIIKLTLKYPDCPFVVTSRPNEFTTWENFYVAHLLPFDYRQCQSFIKKIDYVEERKTDFLEFLTEDKFKEHEEFLSNPLGEILRYLGHDKIIKLQELSDKTLEELKRAGIRVADNIIQQGIEAAKREIGRQFDNIFRFPFLPRLF